MRWTSLGLFVAVLMAAAYLSWTAETVLRSASASAHHFETRAGALTLAVMELRMGQQAYVAAGQGDEFWGSRVAAKIAEVRDELAAVRALAVSANAQAQIDEAISSLSDFERMDERAREYSRGNQQLLASDLIFSDGLEKTGAMLDAIQQARTEETETGDALVRGARRRQLGLAVGTAGAALALALVLTPGPRSEPIEPQAVGERPESPIAEGTLMLRDARDPVPPLPAETPPSIRETQPEPRDVFDLGRVAALCTDLARIVDTRSLPKVLERTASVLDANGVVLWIADPDGRELNPVVTHGYPPQLVTRLGTIPRDAQNATAAAFRTALLQTVHADAFSHGAIAVPLVTPGGCVGVMAAEVRDCGEQEDAKLAAAAIVAAQLATLVGPPSSRTNNRAEAAAGA